MHTLALSVNPFCRFIWIPQKAAHEYSKSITAFVIHFISRMPATNTYGNSKSKCCMWIASAHKPMFRSHLIKCMNAIKHAARELTIARNWTILLVSIQIHFNSLFAGYIQPNRHMHNRTEDASWIWCSQHSVKWCSSWHFAQNEAQRTMLHESEVAGGIHCKMRMISFNFITFNK